MTKKEKTKLIVWSCIGVAVLAAILLFFFMPRRGDKLLRLPDAESVYGLYMVDSTVTPYGSSHFYEVNSTTTNTRLVQEYYDLLARTKLYFVNTTGGVKYYADEPNTGELFIVYIWCDNALKPVTFRTDGVVYYGNYLTNFERARSELMRACG